MGEHHLPACNAIALVSIHDAHRHWRIPDADVITRLRFQRILAVLASQRRILSMISVVRGKSDSVYLTGIPNRSNTSSSGIGFPL